MIPILVLLLFFPFAVAIVQGPMAEKEVLAAMQVWKQAMVTRDQAAMEALYAPDLDYAHSNGRHENKAEAIEAVINGEQDRIDRIERNLSQGLWLDGARQSEDRFASAKHRNRNNSQP